jgi:hypothetical protein
MISSTKSANARDGLVRFGNRKVRSISASTADGMVRGVPTSYSLPKKLPIAAGVSRLRFTTSAQRVAGQSVNPRLVIFSVKKSLSLGHGRDRLAYPEVALLKIVSK